MPAKSQAQRALIFSKRDQYGSKKKTPKKWKWIWDEGWENKGKLPKRKKKKAKFVNESLNEFLNEAENNFYDALTQTLMKKGIDYDMAYFAVGTLDPDFVNKWSSEYDNDPRSIGLAAEEVLNDVFNK